MNQHDLRLQPRQPHRWKLNPLQQRLKPLLHGASTDDDKTDLDQLAKKRLPAPVKDKGKSSAKFPAHKREKTSPSGLRAEPPGETEESAQFADRPMDFEITAEQAEIRDRLTAIHPGILESHNTIAENNQEPAEDDADRARERRHLEQAIRTASRISEDRNRRLDGIPRRQEDGQAKPKQPKTEELHLTEITEEEILHTVVESRLGTEEKKAFTEAKRKALTPWSENDAWRAVRRGQMPQRHNCSCAVLAQVQGGQASCEGDPTGLQSTRMSWSQSWTLNHQRSLDLANT